MRGLCGSLLFLAMASPALASGGLNCSADDASAKFELQAGVTRGLGGPTFNFRGELEILDTSVVADLRKVTFADSNLPQYWLDGEELRLLAYTERDAQNLFGSVELEIRTKALGGDDEGTYEGRYKLDVSDMSDQGSGEAKTTNFSGKVTCFVE